MKADSTNVKQYKKHLRKQKKFVSKEAVENLGKIICQEISMLMNEGTNELWLSLLEIILVRCVEYWNLSCFYFKEAAYKNSHVFFKNINRLAINLESRDDLFLYEPYINSLMEKLENLLNAPCSGFYIQESIHWFCAETFFETDKITCEPKYDIIKQLLSLSSHSPLEDLNYDDSLKPIALNALKAIKELHSNIDLYIIHKNLGYNIAKSLCIMRYLAGNEYIESILNEDFEDLGYGIRMIRLSLPEIEEQIKQKD